MLSYNTNALERHFVYKHLATHS